MSERERQQLRRLLDRAVRARLADQDADERSAVDRRRCADCGMPYDEWTPGCEKCADRARRRGRRWTHKTYGGFASPLDERRYRAGRLAADEYTWERTRDGIRAAHLVSRTRS